jgi:hypothetical protein
MDDPTVVYIGMRVFDFVSYLFGLFFGVVPVPRVVFELGYCGGG